jgi:hypothetical protein
MGPIHSMFDHSAPESGTKELGYGSGPEGAE